MRKPQSALFPVGFQFLQHDEREQSRNGAIDIFGKYGQRNRRGVRLWH